MTVTEAVFSRDALAKHIYSFLFQWIVSSLNDVRNVSNFFLIFHVVVIDVDVDANFVWLHIFFRWF